MLRSMNGTKLHRLGSTKLVIIGGIAELLSGSISMGLGAYLAATTDRQIYENETLQRTRKIEDAPGEAQEELYRILNCYGPNRAEIEPFVNALCMNKSSLIEVFIATKRNVTWSVANSSSSRCVLNSDWRSLEEGKLTYVL
jgi:hypothetical protein